MNYKLSSFYNKDNMELSEERIEELLFEYLIENEEDFINRHKENKSSNNIKGDN